MKKSNSATILFFIFHVTHSLLFSEETATGNSSVEADIGILVNGKIIWSSAPSSKSSILDPGSDFLINSSHTISLKSANSGSIGAQITAQVSIGNNSSMLTLTNMKGDRIYTGQFDFQSISSRAKHGSISYFSSSDSTMVYNKKITTAASTPDDSNQFDNLMLASGYSGSGQARGFGVPIPKNPLLPPSLIPFTTSFNTVPPFSDSFILAAGIEEVVFSYQDGNGNNKKSYFYRKNQADVFYYSGHGHITTLVIGNNLNVSTIIDEWRENLKLMIIAGCSMMSYNAMYDGAIRNSIQYFLKSGPKKFCGYGWYGTDALGTVLNSFSTAPFAPADIQEGDPLFSANIVKYYLQHDLALNTPRIWLLTNDFVSSHAIDGVTLVGRGKQSRNANAYHSMSYEIIAPHSAQVCYWSNTNKNAPVFTADIVTF